MTTLKQIRDQFIDDLDLNESSWKSNNDIDKIINKAIRKAHGTICGVHSDYFLTNSEVALAADDNEIDYPSDIYVNKIKSIHFLWDNNSCEIKPVKRFDKELLYSAIANPSDSPYRSWLAVDNATTGRKIKLFPETGYAGTLSIWYIRQPKTLDADADICDIDEFTDYVLLIAKAMYLMIDSDPRFDEAHGEEIIEEARVINVVKDMTEDDEDEIVPDYSHYESSV